MTTGETPIAPLAERLRAARRVTVLTGAGVSAASGVPTFRGTGGWWKNRRLETLSSAEGFARDPRLVWEWYDLRRTHIAGCRPNRAHEVLAAWSRRFPNFSLVTQNIDGLHERAGTRGVIRFHGSLWEVSCAAACPGSPPRWRDETAPFPVLPPPCPHCGGILRPAVTWFGEAIDPDVLEASIRAAECDVFLSVGTSALVFPAAGLIEEARARGAFTVEINPEPTPLADLADLRIAAPAETALDETDRFL
jgi:NAD-dependent deacetylase